MQFHKVIREGHFNNTTHKLEEKVFPLESLTNIVIDTILDKIHKKMPVLIVSARK